MSLLFVHTGGVGDFLVAAPSFHRYAAGRPWDVAGYRTRGALAVTAGWARAAYDLDTLDFSSVFSEPSSRLLAALAAYDEVVVWLGRAPEQEALRRKHGLGQVRFLPALPPSGWERHAADFYAETLGLACTPPPHLPVDPVQVQDAVVLHAGSGSPAKNWPYEAFADICDTLHARGHEVLWSSGPAEEGLPCPGSATPLPAQPLPELARTLAGARLYIGNDSGITHLAAAVGCPTLALFQTTNPNVWGPRGKRVTILRAPTRESVLTAAATALSGHLAHDR